MIQHLTEIVEEARKRGKKRLAVAYGQDSHTLEAVYEAYKEGIVEPTRQAEISYAVFCLKKKKTQPRYKN